MSSHSSFTPLLDRAGTLGTLKLRNRVVMSSLTRNRSIPTSYPNQDNVEYYRQRAQGGFGLILSEGALISQQGCEWPHAAGIWSKDHVSAWRPVVEAVHQEDCAIVCQLWHVGRQSHHDMPEQIASGEPAWAPSAIGARGGKFRDLPGNPGYTVPTPVEDPVVILDQYKRAAQFAKEAGFDGVELHAGNGYLCEQFLSDMSNKREDKWGGTRENRARFTLAAIDSLLEIWPAGSVGIKLSPGGGFGDSSFSSAEELVATHRYLVEELEKRHLAYLQFVNYDADFDPHHGGEAQGYDHDVLATYSDLVHGQRIMANLGWTSDSATTELAKPESKVYAFAFGRASIANPDLPIRMRCGYPLQEGNPKTFYTSAGQANGHGYTDYPSWEAQSTA